ncbi:MAG: S8 family serine peptidase [Bacteroidota bacterium]
MLRKLSTALLFTLLFFSCSKDIDEPVKVLEYDLLSKEAINQTIYDDLEVNGIYNWDRASSKMLYSAAMQSDSIYAIGYQIAGMQDLPSKIHEIDIESTEWIATRDKVLQVILDGEKANHPGKEIIDLLPHGYPNVTPSMAVHFTNPATIEKLRNMEEIRYLEAMGYELPPLAAREDNNAVERSGSGCDNGAPSNNINSSDYTTISPFVKRSWNYASSNIPTAWNTTSGSGVTVAIIDTGVSNDQENLGSQFNSGNSSGRFVQRYSTKYSGSWWWRSLDSPHDDCGHGTRMAGIATAPRGSDGNAVGIAYNANLIGIRAVSDVIISSSNEKDGVKDALILAGNRSDVKVISMSIGTPFYSGTVADGVYFAYNKGKLINAAAGTSFSWTTFVGVIFPATMSQCYAITGVKDSNPLTKCHNCHQGSQVQFVMRMQRSSSNSRVALSVANYSNTPAYTGGSSCATASLSGIAALVFANNPGASRSFVYNALRANGSYYPNKNGNLGWGIVDANGAINY